MTGDIRSSSRESSKEDDGSKGEKLALTIGTFDGVHIGHQLLLGVTRDIANVRGITSAAYTYELPPKRYLSESGPALVMDPQSKLEYLKQFVEKAIVGNFHKVKDFPPERFVEEILVDKLDVDAVVVGDDWRFGRNRTGSYRDLENMSDGRFTVHPQRQLTKDGRPVSSTWIREALADGNVKLSRELLGRYPTYSGEVVRGNQVGSDIGFPTANISLDRRVVLPKRGNYAAFAHIDGNKVKGAVHIGNRPTFGGDENHQVEVHLFNFDKELYEERIKVQLVHYLSRNREYSGKEELKRAIKNHVDEARKVLDEVSSVN
ncbi:riboflavin biosynthesis protein RibF [Candidatus Bipolaricaulota bacterium]|nr:riboflavin biosynthesis protein RibF [Candidatus Bipolaricaulota bacterium]